MHSQIYDALNSKLNMHSEPEYVPIDNPIDDDLNVHTDEQPPNLLESEQPTDLPNNLTKKEIFASQLVGDLPICPECNRVLKKRTLARCDYCGFSFSYLEKLLPTNQLPILDAVLDFSGRLSSDEQERIKEAISFVQKRYPQFIPKVCLLPLQPDIEVHQMALWMINQCPPAGGEQQQDKEWYVLLLIDTSKKKSAMAYGYQAEIFIPDEASGKLISQLNRSLKKEKIGFEITDLMNELVPILDCSKRMLKKNYKSFKRLNR